MANPIAQQDEDGRDDNCKTGTASMEGPDCGGGSGDEGEKEAGAEPVNDAGIRRVEVGGSVGDGREGEPL